MKFLVVVDEGYKGVSEEVVVYLKNKHNVQVTSNDEQYIEAVQKHEGVKIWLSNDRSLPEKVWESVNVRNSRWLVLTENKEIPHKKLIEEGVNFIILPPNPSAYLVTKDTEILSIAIDILTWCIDKLKIKERSLAILSRKENEVVNLILQGLDDQEISNKLFISDKTVRNHVSNILQKVGLKNRTQLVLWALQQIGKIEQLS